MLVLKRINGESIHIYKDIKLTIFYQYGSEVKVGIDAPKEVNIVRKKLVKKSI